MKLNLGSGQRPFDPDFGWVNIDVQSSIKVDGVVYKPELVTDITKPLPFENDSIAMAVAHHSLEHMDAFREGQDFLREVYRILQPKASLIITVPNTKALAIRYLIGQIDGYTYRVNMHGAFMGSEFDRHKWSYDWEELRQKLMSAASWSRIRLFDWREITGASIVKDWWILGVEAVK